MLWQCALTEETLNETEIHFSNNRLASIFIALSSVNIVQYVFSCGSVAMAGTTRTRGSIAVVNFRSSNAFQQPQGVE
jgi:hypothetical protein